MAAATPLDELELPSEHDTSQAKTGLSQTRDSPVLLNQHLATQPPHLDNPLPHLSTGEVQRGHHDGDGDHLHAGVAVF